jgi:hypothetical protein
MFDLTGRKALVTGATGGLGEEIARMLHAQGATVGLHGTRVEKLEALAAELGDRVHIFPANLSDRAAWVVGPEGGFTDEEELLMRNSGALPLNLGPWVLRLETAASAGIAVLRQIMALLAIVFLFTGCTPDPARDPFVRKAERARGKGDYVTSLNFYRRASSRHPESHYIYLQMANLCDESLDDPVAALFYYNEFLKFSPPDSPYIQSAKTCRDLVRKRLLRKLGREENNSETEKLRAENARLKRMNSTLRRIIKNGK